jgi:hypothetical protein
LVDREYLESLAQRVAAELRLPVMLARRRVGQLADVWCRQRPTNKCSAAFPKWKSDQFASNKQVDQPNPTFKNQAAGAQEARSNAKLTANVAGGSRGSVAVVNAGASSQRMAAARSSARNWSIKILKELGLK